MESYTIGRLSSVVDTGRCRSALGVRRMLHGLLIRGKIRLDVRLEIGETLNSLGRRNEGSESEDRWSAIVYFRNGDCEQRDSSIIVDFSFLLSDSVRCIQRYSSFIGFYNLP